MEGLIFRSGTQALGPEGLVGFFEGWPDPPSPETHLEILRNSWAVELAREQTTGRVVGFINAISDGVYSAYIPLLEILPSHRGKGIGQELVRRLLKRCKGFYMVDVCCDEDVVPFYRRFGMIEVKGMCQRSFDFQSGVVSGLKED